MKHFIDFIYNISLLINACLFIPQAVRIIRARSAKGVSAITFIGFAVVLIALAMHAMQVGDTMLLAGSMFSLFACTCVIILIFIYRERNQHSYEDLTLADIIAQMPGHVYWKGKDGKFLGSNTNNWRDFGLNSLADYVGKTDVEVFSKEEAEYLQGVQDMVMRSGEEKILEEPLTTVDGKKTFYLSHKLPLRNADNNIVGMLGLSVDITHAKREMSERLAVLEEIIAVMPGRVYWIDRKGRYLGCNDNEADAHGLSSRKDIVGTNLEAPREHRQVMETGHGLSYEESHQLEDGQQATFLVNKVPLHDSQDNIIGMVSAATDITQLKKQEQDLKVAKEKAEAANKLITDFVHNMEHDIRTPFSGIYSLAEMLAETEVDPDKKEILTDIKHSAQELLDYCNHILEFSEAESNAHAIVEKRFELQPLIASVIHIEKVAAKVKKLNFIFNFDTTLPKTIISDPYRLKRMLINLISNAIKFTEQGSVAVDVRCGKILIPERELVLEIMVKDTGIGISEDKQEFIYERFAKVNPSNRGIYKGLGLGLTLVKRFTKELDGDIYLNSKLGQGSEFMLSLPVKIPYAV